MVSDQDTLNQIINYMGTDNVKVQFVQVTNFMKKYKPGLTGKNYNSKVVLLSINNLWVPPKCVVKKLTSM